MKRKLLLRTTCQDCRYGNVYAHPKEISLLSNDQKGAIGNIGTAAQGSIQETFQQLAASSPELGACSSRWLRSSPA